jgi:hypothetical protein
MPETSNGTAPGLGCVFGFLTRTRRDACNRRACGYGWAGLRLRQCLYAAGERGGGIHDLGRGRQDRDTSDDGVVYYESGRCQRVHGATSAHGS